VSYIYFSTYCKLTQSLVYVHNINLLDDSTNNVKAKTETLLKSSWDIGLEIQRRQSLCSCLIIRTQDRTRI